MKKEALENSEVVKDLVRIARRSGGEPKLVGGAVVDIVQGRTPKDYDIIDAGKSFRAELINQGFKYKWETKTAVTFTKEGIVVQLLKTKMEDFDFTVSQSYVCLRKGYYSLREFEIENKLLIPLDYEDRTKILNTLSRIPHWMKKGFRMKEVTYYSLLNGLNSKETKHIPTIYPQTS